MTDRRQITSFTFKLAAPNGGVVESQIWGAGGLLGDGMLHAYDGTEIRSSERIAASLRWLLKRAIRDQRDNDLRLFVDADDPSKRIVFV